MFYRHRYLHLHDYLFWQVIRLAAILDSLIALVTLGAFGAELEFLAMRKYTEMMERKARQ